MADNLKIGAVCKALSEEFPDISISKIRYLEDQNLLTPRRSSSGYRRYSDDDIERLRLVLRMQRDQYLPLRVIKEQLDSGRVVAASADTGTGEGEGGKRVVRDRSNSVLVGLTTEESYASLADVVKETGANEKFISELADFGIVNSDIRAGKPYYDQTNQEVIRVAWKLAEHGISPRNLRSFRSAADHESTLIKQLMGSTLKSPNQTRRKQAVHQLEELAASVATLQTLLLRRNLRYDLLR